MNANELIEFQEDNASAARANRFSDVMFIETADMLRQQQADLEHMWMANTVLEAEIEALKDRLMLAQQSLSIVETWVKE
jgi:cell division protein FtsB